MSVCVQPVELPDGDRTWTVLGEDHRQVGPAEEFQHPRATWAQAGAVVVQAPDHVAAHDIAQFVHASAGPVQQVLLTVRAAVAGVLSIILGCLVAASLPSSAAWALGLVVGIDLIFWGVRALTAAWLLDGTS